MSSYLNWTQVCCIYSLLFYLIKLYFFSKYMIYEKKSKSEESKTSKAAPKNVESPLRKLSLYLFISWIVIASVLAFFGFLHWAILFPVDEKVAQIGNMVSIVAVLLMIWTHLELGKSWSPVVTKQVSHKLVTSGPYALMRHPMYAAGYLQPLGVWLLTNNWMLTLPFVLQKVLVTARIKMEDKLMVELFGDEYLQYHRVTPAVLPFRIFGFDLGLTEKEAIDFYNANKSS